MQAYDTYHSLSGININIIIFLAEIHASVTRNSHILPNPSANEQEKGNISICQWAIHQRWDTGVIHQNQRRSNLIYFKVVRYCPHALLHNGVFQRRSVSFQIDISNTFLVTHERLHIKVC